MTVAWISRWALAHGLQVSLGVKTVIPAPAGIQQTEKP
jgi:hypothetical protein